MKREEVAAAVDRRIAMAATLLALSKQQDGYPLLSESVNDSALFQLSMALRHFMDESFLVFTRPLVNWSEYSIGDVLHKADIAPLIELKQLEQKGSWVTTLVKHSITSLFNTPKNLPTLIASDTTTCLTQPSEIISYFRAFLEAQRESMVEY